MKAPSTGHRNDGISRIDKDIMRSGFLRAPTGAGEGTDSTLKMPQMRQKIRRSGLHPDKKRGCRRVYSPLCLPSLCRDVQHSGNSDERCHSPIAERDGGGRERHEKNENEKNDREYRARHLCLP